MKLLHARLQDGQPAFRFIHLRRLSISVLRKEDRWAFGQLVLNARFLQKLELSLGINECSVGLHRLLSPRARTLKYLEVSLHVHTGGPERLPLGGLCRELEAMAGNNILEALCFVIYIEVDDTEETIGPTIQNLETALLKPGWSTLRRVSITLICTDSVSVEEGTKINDGLQSLSDNYLSQLSEAVELEYIVDIWTR
jgi:hypothetical protein